ncbi:MAG: thioredoxin family protein [Candidatus Zixiibacteriota bacterium]
MTIQILGTGCARCKQLFSNTQTAVIQANIEADVEKVEDIKAILAFGVMSTPALVVDGVVKFSGKVPSVEELKKILAQ